MERRHTICACARVVGAPCPLLGSAPAAALVTGSQRLACIAVLLCVCVLGEVVYQVVDGARPAIYSFGIRFVGRSVSAPNFGVLRCGRGDLWDRRQRLDGVGPGRPARDRDRSVPEHDGAAGLEVNRWTTRGGAAAIPSVIVGFWGVVGAGSVRRQPFRASSVLVLLGFIPFFGPPQTTELSIFTAGLGLTVMVLPIIAGLSCDLCRTVPMELVGRRRCTRRSRGGRSSVESMLPTNLLGLAAGSVLGLGRALGEGNRRHPDHRRRCRHRWIAFPPR